MSGTALQFGGGPGSPPGEPDRPNIDLSHCKFCERLEKSIARPQIIRTTAVQGKGVPR